MILEPGSSRGTDQAPAHSASPETSDKTAIRIPAARSASGLCWNLVPPNEEGQGMPGAGRTRRPCVLKKGRCTQVGQVRPTRPAFPAQWLYGLLRALPGVRAF